MSITVDLRELAVRRDGGAPPPPRRRHLLSRVLLPAGILLGLLGVLAWSARDTLSPSRPVTVVPVLTTRSEVRQAGAPLFQSAGWVEPRPTPALVTALAEGVVEEVLVVEGQEVKAGQPVARLVRRDAELALAAARADLRLRQVERAGARALLEGAKLNWDRPAHLKAAVAEAKAMLAQKETERASLPFHLRSARAKLRTAGHNLARLKRAAPGAVAQAQLDEAQGAYDSVKAAVDELSARQEKLDREVTAQKAKHDALAERLRLKADEARALADAEARVEAAGAKVKQAEVAVEQARLRLERMTVRAPGAGRVLALVARPGTRLMGMVPGGHSEASTVASLYDPARLQVRADVRLEDVPRVRRGQKVVIETPAAPEGPLGGEVLYPTSLADVQKNTLQVKVSITSPPPALRPDMLVQVTFLAPEGRGKEGPSERLRLLVPRGLVESGEGGAWVWVADQAAGRARRKPVKLGPSLGGLVEVTEGLTPADRLIAGGREGLREGERIHVAGEDTSGVAEGDKRNHRGH